MSSSAKEEAAFEEVRCGFLGPQLVITCGGEEAEDRGEGAFYLFIYSCGGG